MKFSVSVIIPVYNGEQFIKKAIISAVNQPEVAEVIVINDGSTDNTQNIIKKLQLTNSKIKFYQHKNNENKGRSASRNLGIKKALSKYLAFLDADDYYLKERFLSDKEKFQSNIDIDGVYNAVGFHFYREVSKTEQKTLKLNTVIKNIDPNDLFEVLMSGKYGHFHINGLTVKKSVFSKIGFFNNNLVVAEDTEIFWKMALKCQLITGIFDKPVAMRGVHDTNVFNREDLYDKYFLRMYETLISWCTHNQVSISNIDDLLKWLWIFRYKTNTSLLQHICFWSYFVIVNPRLLFSKLSIKYFPLIRLRRKLFPFLFNK
tara:strand:- start:1 stop:951 length:951 start_codon:yes stop_codon:yes gene_type:complete